MLSAGFLIPPREHLIAAFEKQDFVFAALPFKLIQTVKQPLKLPAAAHIDDQRHPRQLVL